MKVLCIIPARKGSKAIKNKNILKIKGKYLFAYSIEFAKKLKFLDKIIFSSDSKSYIKKAKKFDSIFFNLRPKKYSTDNSLMVDYVKYQLTEEKKIGNILSMESYFGINLMEKKSLFGIKRKKKINEKSRLFNKNLGGGAILDLGCYPSSMSLLIASLKSTFTDVELTTPPNDSTATSDVPPPISTTIDPVGSATGKPAPIAAATGSSIR